MSIIIPNPTLICRQHMVVTVNGNDTFVPCQSHITITKYPAQRSLMCELILSRRDIFARQTYPKINQPSNQLDIPVQRLDAVIRFTELFAHFVQFLLQEADIDRTQNFDLTGRIAARRS